jgi:hypothetical protein
VVAAAVGNVAAQQFFVCCKMNKCLGATTSVEQTRGSVAKNNAPTRLRGEMSALKDNDSDLQE